MPRFFLAGGNMAGGIVVLSESDAEHARVLRMRVGDRLVVCDGEGKTTSAGSPGWTRRPWRRKLSVRRTVRRKPMCA
jgi:16S rRNA U1498 N3-methylase RsmE